MKKFFFLCLCMISVTANAARVVDGINYEFDRDNNLAYVVAADASSPYTGKIEIPEKIKVGNNEFTVVGINKNAFSNSKITSIFLPNTLIEIQEGAFSNCNGLSVAYLPDGIKSIGKNAFEWCKNIVDISLPNNSELVIGKEAFKGLTSLKALVIPNSFTHIGDDTNNYIFSQCGLTQLYIGRKLKRIGPYTFESCKNLSEIICPQDAVLEEIGNGAFSECESIKSMKISPRTIKKIGMNAFYHCNALQEVFISYLVDSIGGGSYDLKAKRLSIDDGATPYTFYGNGRPIIQPVYAYLGKEMINYNPNLKYQPFGTNNLKRVDLGPYFKGGPEIKFGNNVEIIYSYVTDPSKITCEFEENVYDNAILYVPVGLVDKYMAQDNFSKFFDVREFYPEAFLGYLINGTGLIKFEDYTVKNICLDNWDFNYDCELSISEAPKITDIGDIFYSKKISSFDEFQYFTSVKEIPKRAFFQNPLTSIVIPNGVETIGESAFQFTNLKCIDLPSSVITIGKNSFANNEDLTTVRISSNVKSIGNAAFWGCTSITDIICEAITVPSAESNTFFDSEAYDNITLHVPSAALDEYKKTAPWKNFKKIVVYKKGDVNGDGDFTKSDVELAVNLVIGDTPSGYYKMMADVNKDGKVDATDIVLLIKMMK